MRHTVVSSAECANAGTFSVQDFMSRIASRYGCHVCGLTPANVNDTRRPNPRTALLEPDGIDSADPLQRTVFRCIDREACESRRRMMESRRGG